MPKKDNQGSYELVDSQSFGKDLENNVISSSDDVFPQSVDATDANLLRNKFDTLTSPGTRSRFSFKAIKRRKFLVGFLVLFIFLIAGSVVYVNKKGIDVWDHYKDKGSGDNAVPEVENSKGNEALNNGESTGDKEQQDAKLKPAETEEPTSGQTSKGSQEETNQNNGNTATKKLEKITMESLRSGKFFVYDSELSFINPSSGLAEFDDQGLYYTRSHDKIVAEKGTDKSYSQVLLPNFEFQHEGISHKVVKYYPTYDLTNAIVATEMETVYRHSSLAYYWIHNIAENSFTPLATGEQGALVKLSFATWSPKYNYISYIQDNNLYVKSLKTSDIKQITNDGSKTVLNGRTGWVYEEEVLATDKALWWSSNEKHLIFMRTDESGVPSYGIDYYVQDPSGAYKYPKTKEIPYPKPGFSNPKVSMKVYSVESDETHEIKRESDLGDEYIIYEALFIDDANFIIKETDRESNILHVRHYNPVSDESKVVYKVDAVKEYNGWIEKFNSPIPIPPKSGSSSWGYVDTIVVNGYNHLVYFESTTTETPKALTSGEWEVLNAPLAYNKEKNLVYFAANKRASTDKHIYSVDLETGKIDSFTDDSDQAYYEAEFSPNAKYVSLYYKGPETPVQKLFKVEGKLEMKLLSISTYLEMSKRTHAFPKKNFHKVEVKTAEDETPVELNVIEYLPPNFDSSKKYPLLVHFYGGPGSQVVNSKFDVWFEDSVSSALDAVVLYVEPRGTGGKGWKFRSWQRKKIGYWEPRDITEVAKTWISKGFIDADRTAAWGWSYGGFTTLKTLEFDAGETFKYGMAVAPVTNWLFYDSIYTERYMDKPQNNKEGYEISQISKVGNLGKANRFLIMHGTADDNVHIQNTYSLLDQLDLGGVENYDVHVFPDSDHSIYHHNANIIVYDKLFSWLRDAFQGDFDKLGAK
ncbi:unnamed protein product [Wickerhamomyces anomalus]